MPAVVVASVVASFIFVALAASRLLHQYPTPVLGRCSLLSLAALSISVAIFAALPRSTLEESVVSRLFYLTVGLAAAVTLFLAGVYLARVAPSVTATYRGLHSEGVITTATIVVRVAGLLLLPISLVSIVMAIVFAISPP